MPPVKKVTKDAKPKGKGKSKKGKKKKPIDWTDEAHFDKNRVMVYIEHTEECPIFKTKATQFIKYLEATFPDKVFQLIRNQTAPREGAFEIHMCQTAKTPRELIWSGIDKGPPRTEKFPESYEEVLTEVKYVLNKLYMDIPEDEPEVDESAPSPADEPEGSATKVSPKQKGKTKATKKTGKKTAKEPTPTPSAMARSSIKRPSTTKKLSGGAKSTSNAKVTPQKAGSKKASLVTGTSKRVLGAMTEKKAAQK